MSTLTPYEVGLLPPCWRVLVRVGNGKFEILTTRDDTRDTAERLARYEREVGGREAYAVEYSAVRVLP